MAPNQNMNTKFRAALRNELPIWIREGLVSEDAAAHLSSTYQLSNLKEESSRLLSAVIFTIGGLLLGGGVISFVAANWEDISTPVKLAILFSALLGFHAVGYWLWRSAGWRRLGHALIFCGCLVFGANIGLVAQIFHIRGDWYGAFGAWAVGSLVMAWALRSWIIGVLVLCTSFLWFIGFQDDNHQRAAVLYPFVLAIALIPLAWIIPSRVLYAGTLLGIVIAAGVIAGNHGSANQTLLSMGAGGLFMWTLGELHRAAGWRREFANITAGLGLSVLAATAYIWSFHDLWNTPKLRLMQSLLGILFLALSIAATFLLWRRERQTHPWLIIGVLVVGSLLTCASLINGEISFTIITNLAALTLAAVMIGMSLIDEQRVVFWLGSLYLVLLILSRFLEYETSLLVKSAAFLACGVAVILAGISYEKYLRRKVSSMEGNKDKEIVYE
ncbi:MAG: DUF2157 domain-containing protein [Blastocatellia bacterium]